MPQPQSTKPNPIVIKKYANRRLYNTDTSSYVTLDDLCQMIKRGEEIIVYDAKNGDDITRGVLTQIIVEQESKDGQNLLPTSFLRQLISMYGGSMQGLVPKYLEYTMQSFTKNQHQMQDYFRNAFGNTTFGNNAFGNMFSMNTLEEVSKQNMAIFEQAMKLFAPFATTQGAVPMTPSQAEAENEDAASETTGGSPHLRPVPSASDEQDEPQDEVAPDQEEMAEEEGGESDTSIRDMQQRLNDLQKQIANMQKGE